MLRWFLITLAVWFALLPDFSFAQVKPVSEKLCEFRQMLCGGGAGLGIAMIVIVTVGLLTIIGKVNWTFVLIMGGCLIIYFAADQITTEFMGGNLDVDCPCE